MGFTFDFWLLPSNGRLSSALQSYFSLLGVPFSCLREYFHLFCVLRLSIHLWSAPSFQWWSLHLSFYHFLNSVFGIQMSLILIKSNLAIFFSFMEYAFVISKKPLPNPRSSRFFYLFFKSFNTFSLWYIFELIFSCMVWSKGQCSSFCIWIYENHLLKRLPFPLWIVMAPLSKNNHS